MLQGSLSGDPVDVGSIVGHAVVRVIRDVILMELALPVEHVIHKIGRIAKYLLLGIFNCKAT
jgi:hypothetical protein